MIANRNGRDSGIMIAVWEVGGSRTELNQDEFHLFDSGHLSNEIEMVSVSEMKLGA